MFNFLRKKFFIIVGFFFTVLVSFIGFIFSRSSKDDSLFISTANADIASWAGTDAGCGGSGCGGCSGGCFPEGVQVSTLQGYKEIQDIVINDVVSGFNPKTLNIDQYKVLKTMKHSWDEVHTDSPLIIINHEKGTLRVTKNHPLYRKGYSCEGSEDFCEAGGFSVGDSLTLADGSLSKIISIEDGPEYDFVYNFEVEDVHTYIAGGILVHNSCFPAGVVVSTPSGDKEIQDIRVGDIVYGFDIDTGEIKESQVSKTMKHDWDNVHREMNAPLIIINHEKGTFRVTKNHPLYRKGYSCEGSEDFCEAGGFSVGDSLTLADGSLSKIISIEDGPEYDFVYNFEVEDVNTYIANGVRVHA